MKIGADYYFYHNDHIGTPQKMTSVSGAVVWSANYSSFGEASVEVGTVSNNLRFAGQYYDAETGLHYNYQRYYDPATGRYMTADMIGFAGGVNLFAYAEHNPINKIDPQGLFTWHGNWGGSGYAAGKNVAESKLTLEDFEVPAVDARDACYKGHDKCIWKASNDKCSDEQAISDNIEKCDYRLADCLESISPLDPCFWFQDVDGGAPDHIVPATVEANIIFRFFAPLIH